ncbi:MAG: carboxypeptidase-like regulatory domain-containing protein [Fibrobacterota bacterium]
MKVVISGMLCLLLLALSCSIDVAGGSEVGNPKVVGTVVHQGTPVKNAEVSLFHEKFNPYEDQNENRYVTDSLGRFVLEGDTTGEYKLMVYSSDSTEGVWKNLGHLEDKEYDLDSIELQQTASARFLKSDTAQVIEMYVRGTSIMVSLDAAAAEKEVIIPPGHFVFTEKHSGDTLLEADIDAGEEDDFIVNHNSIGLLVTPGYDTIIPRLVDMLIQVRNQTGFRFRIHNAEEVSTHTLSQNDILLIAPQTPVVDSLVSFMDTLSVPVIAAQESYYSALSLCRDSDNAGTRFEHAVLITEEGLTHPVASFLNSDETTRITVVQDSADLPWAFVGDDADIIAYGIKNQRESYVFIYEKDESLFNDRRAAHHRMGFPLGRSEIDTGDGLRLLSEMILWSLSDN